jgi:hypothetical protein
LFFPFSFPFSLLAGEQQQQQLQLSVRDRSQQQLAKKQGDAGQKVRSLLSRPTKKTRERVLALRWLLGCCAGCRANPTGRGGER